MRLLYSIHVIIHFISYCYFLIQILIYVGLKTEWVVFTDRKASRSREIMQLVVSVYPPICLLPLSWQDRFSYDLHLWSKRCPSVFKTKLLRETCKDGLSFHPAHFWTVVGPSPNPNSLIQYSIQFLSNCSWITILFLFTDYTCMTVF